MVAHTGHVNVQNSGHIILPKNGYYCVPLTFLGLRREVRASRKGTRRGLSPSTPYSINLRDLLCRVSVMTRFKIACCTTGLLAVLFALSLRSSEVRSEGDPCDAQNPCATGLKCSAVGLCMNATMEEIVVTAERITVIRLPLFGLGPRIFGGYSLYEEYYWGLDRYIGYGPPQFLPNAYDSDGDGIIDCIDDLTATSTAPISSSMGWRTINGIREYHGGTDIDVPTGTPLRAAQSGRVDEIYDGMRENEKSFTDNPNGNFVRVNNVDGSQTVIIHMLSVDVDVGDFVFPGDVIGASNNTGRSFRRHAHVQIWRNQNWRSLGLKASPENLHDPEVRYGC